MTAYGTTCQKDVCNRVWGSCMAQGARCNPANPCICCGNQSAQWEATKRGCNQRSERTPHLCLSLWQRCQDHSIAVTLLLHTVGTQGCFSWQDPRFSKILENLRLQKRGTGGVDTAAVADIYDISNLDRLGRSEVGCSSWAPFSLEFAPCF